MKYGRFLIIIIVVCFGIMEVKAADLEVNILVEDYSDKGGLGTFHEVREIPDNNYIYNNSKSFCENKSKIIYNQDKKMFSVDTKGMDKCYLYFNYSKEYIPDNPHTGFVLPLVLSGICLIMIIVGLFILKNKDKLFKI